MQTLVLMLILILSAVSCLGVLVVAFDRRLIVRTYTVISPRLRVPARAVLLADLHGFPYGKEYKTLLKGIANQAPDLILMAGDMVCDKRKRRMENSAFFFGKVTKIAPTYYTPGNHEFRRDDWGDVAALAESLGIVLLSDRLEKVQIGANTFIIGGVDDPERRKKWDRTYNSRAALKQVLSPLAGMPGFHILLGHRPDRIDEYRKYDVDLVVSGHAHGGQVRIPGLLNGLFAPDQGLFPPYAGGLYQHGKTSHVVSRGLAKPFILPKVFNRPEVVVIDITPTQPK
ncbi:MAG: metallophosphoesterase [Peptococcaceae bacterium]|nr:metallophosphoesterase [Peptococcaceae bacterium]